MTTTEIVESLRHVVTTETVAEEREPDSTKFDELVSKCTGEVTQRDRVFYLEFVTDGMRAKPDRIDALLRELANATTLAGSIPELDEVSSTDSTVAALIVSRISPVIISDAIEEQPFVDSVSMWEVAVDALPATVVDRPDPSSDTSAEFDQLRAAFDGGEEPEEFDSRDPARVEFSDDELTFEEVLDGADDAAESTSGEPGIDWGSSEDESVVSKLAEELDRSEQRSEDVDTICRYLIDALPRTSLDVRLTRVQTQVDELLAYVDALEEFLDENGTAAELIEEFRTEVASLEESMHEVRDASARAAEERNALRERVATLEETTLSKERIDERFATLEEAIEGRLDDHEARIEERFVTLEDATVARFDEHDSRIEDRFEQLQGEVDEVDALRIQDRERIQLCIDSLRERQRAHDEWKERLESVFTTEPARRGSGIETGSGP